MDQSEIDRQILNQFRVNQQEKKGDDLKTTKSVCMVWMVIGGISSIAAFIWLWKNGIYNALIPLLIRRTVVIELLRHDIGIPLLTLYWVGWIAVVQSENKAMLKRWWVPYIMYCFWAGVVMGFLGKLWAMGVFAVFGNRIFIPIILVAISLISCMMVMSMTQIITQLIEAKERAAAVSETENQDTQIETDQV